MIDLMKSDIRISLFPISRPQLLPQLHTIFAVQFAHLGRQFQLSAQGFYGDFLFLSTIAQRFDLDLSSLSTQI